MKLQNTGIEHPVLIDVVSGDIRPLEWKKGTTDTLENLPIKDSIMAIADAVYFDWSLLPEAPSSLNAAMDGSTVKLSWQVHGSNRNISFWTTATMLQAAQIHGNGL